MRLLKKRGKLQRVYTQNIDGLEGVGTGLVPVALEGITPSASLPEGKGKGKPKIEGDYVQLHGSVHAVRCTSCAFVRRWTEEDVKAFEAGHVGACPECEGKGAFTAALLPPDFETDGHTHLTQPPSVPPEANAP